MFGLSSGFNKRTAAHGDEVHGVQQKRFRAADAVHLLPPQQQPVQQQQQMCRPFPLGVGPTDLSCDPMLDAEPARSCPPCFAHRFCRGGVCSVQQPLAIGGGASGMQPMMDEPMQM